MRKVVLGILMLAFVSLIILIVIRETSREKVEIEVIFVDELSKEKKETIEFCAIDKYDNFNLIKVEIPEYVDDIYVYVFDLYNFKRNTLPIEYNVVSKEILILNDINLNNDIIYIDIKKTNISIDELNRIVSALKITYRYLGIKDVVLTIEKTSIN